MQVAQQFNSIVMALAGAERIFKLIDEEPEQDTGSVTLVNAKKMRMERLLNAQNVPVCGHGKKPADENGAVTYTELTGDVRFKDVTFGYEEDKIILMISASLPNLARAGIRRIYRRRQDNDHQPDQSFLRHSKR